MYVCTICMYNKNVQYVCLYAYGAHTCLQVVELVFGHFHLLLQILHRLLDLGAQLAHVEAAGQALG